MSTIDITIIKQVHAWGKHAPAVRLSPRSSLYRCSRSSTPLTLRTHLQRLASRRKNLLRELCLRTCLGCLFVLVHAAAMTSRNVFLPCAVWEMPRATTQA